MTEPTDDGGYICPRCGAVLRHDHATGLLWCPEDGCGVVVRRETYVLDAEDAQDGAEADTEQPALDYSPADDSEWTPPPRSRRRTLLVGLVVVLTTVAVLAMAVAPAFRLQRPILLVSPAELSFVDLTGVGVMPQALTIQNRGGRQLDWHATTDAPWLTLNPTSGSIESDLEILTIKADTALLPEGIHFATVTIAGSGAQNSPLIIPVHVQVVTPPEARFSELAGDAVEVYYEVDPPYATGPEGVPIHLVRNDSAVDVTWTELSEFLSRDATDQAPYIEDWHMCGAFSETLYNNAEAAGIRAAWVSLDLLGRDIGHALNAFLTTDRGLVFVDCTGGDAAVLSPGDGGVTCDHDKVAYVLPGEECGMISLDQADSPSYEFYTAYSDAWIAYVAELEEYKRLEDEWNDFVSSHLLIPGGSDARLERQLRADLQSRRASLEAEKKVLGDCRWMTLGVVEMVHIYW